MSLHFKTAVVAIAIILSLSTLLLPTFSTLSSSVVSTTIIPLWAFNGAYANYSLILTVGNTTVDTGWEIYTINQLNMSAGTFNMTTEFFDQVQASRGQGVLSANQVVPLNRSLVFSALNSSELDMLNQGILPGSSQNTSVVTSILVSVMAGTFQADQVTSSGGSSLIWIDSYSGLVLKSGVTLLQNLGTNGTQSQQIETELSSTNIPMSATLPFSIAWLFVSGVAGTFVVIGLVIALVRRGKVEIQPASSPGLTPETFPVALCRTETCRVFHVFPIVLATINR